MNILSDTSTATPTFFSFSIAWNSFFHPITFSLCVSLNLKSLLGSIQIYLNKLPYLIISKLLFFYQIKLWIFYFFNIYLFIYLWLHWLFVAVHGLSLVVASGGYSLLRCTGFSLWWLLLLQSTGSRHMGLSSCGSWALGYRLSSCGTWA